MSLATQEPIKGVNYVVASDNALVPVDSLAQTMTYNGSNQLSTIAVSYMNHTYTQTYTYTSGYVTGISQWVMS